MVNFNKIITLLLMTLLVTGCQQDKEDLTAYVATVKSKQAADIEPMPVMKTYEKFIYSAKDLQNPFIPTVVDVEAAPLIEEEIKVIIDNGIHPDRTRLKEALESYSLDELRLVGTLEQDTVWALIRVPEGVIHKVKVGDYIGRDHGQIMTVTDAELTLKEVIPDGDSGYIERDSSLSVIDVN